MTTAVIGATGRVGTEIVRGPLARGDTVAALVRDPDKAHRDFREPDRLRIRRTGLVLTDPALWGAHHDLTGPDRMSWPDALELLSMELGEPV
jgi:uncharacterized protein YbjT (DUF2867 family)